MVTTKLTARGETAARWVYGPVPSRRLGRSLGIDLVPFKTCSYDCIYCQLGRTTTRTTERREWVPVNEVLAELGQRLAQAPAPNWIALAGSGEPTLHSRLGELITGIKSATKIPVAVLTNGSLLWQAEVRAALAEADLVLPSLDAWDGRSFAAVNRPHPDVSFARMTQGLIDFAAGFTKPIWLEVFLLAGISDSPRSIDALASIVAEIRPARVQLNSVSRPPAERRALAVPPATLAALAARFPGGAEVIAAPPRGRSRRFE